MTGPGSQTLAPQTVAQEQRMAALSRANAIRLGRADFKRTLKADGPLYAPLRAAHVLCMSDRPEWLDGMRIAELVAACPRWGRYRIASLLAAVEVPELKTVGAATHRQRQATAWALESAVRDRLSRRDRIDFERALRGDG